MCVLVAVMSVSQGCATAARRPPSLADTVAAVVRLQGIGDNYWRYLQASKPEIPSLAGVRVSRFPSPNQEKVRRDGRFARSGLTALDEVFVDALPQDGYVTWQAMRWEMEAMAGWPAFHWTHLSDLSPGRSAFDRVLEVIALQRITDVGAGQRFLGLINSIPQVALDLRDEFAERASRDVRLPRIAMDRAVAHVRSLIAPASASPFGLPPDFVVSPESAWRWQLSLDVPKAITERVNPALDSLLSWLEGARAQSPDEFGMARLPGGDAHYAALLRYHSTIDLSPVEAHAVGLREVSRMAGLAAAARRDAGLPVSRDSLRALLASDSQFVVRDAGTIPELAAAIHDALTTEFDTLFPPPTVTKLSIGILPEAESSSALTRYKPPNVVEPDALYLIHPTKLASRSLMALPGLIAGDLMPGLHHQRATQLENVVLPLHRRFSFHAGFVHGWQLYALHVTDSLSRALTPAQRFGIRLRELAAACGLVVDTGINSLGWTREDALAFLRAYLPLDDADLDQEFILEAIESPGTLGAGTLGARELRGLRQWVERELGPRFRLAAFHAELLRVGSLPLPVLGSHLERWIWEQTRPAPEVPGARR
jgi:uncharacterized protein (DUF885 family)